MQAIENIYEAFSHYPLRPVIEGCTCGCISEEDHEKLHANPLREMIPDQLEMFAFKALTTWGNAADFKHFLPRIFELLILDDEWLIEGQVIAGKLNLAEWQSWPESERAAVEDILAAWWDRLLSDSHYHISAEECLCSIAIATDDTSSYLETWEQSITVPAMHHLAQFIMMNAGYLSQHKLSDQWPAHPTQQVIDWLLNLRLVDELEIGSYPDVVYAVDMIRNLIG